MAATATPSTHIVGPRPCVSVSHRISGSRITYFGDEIKGSSHRKLRSSSFISETLLLSKSHDYKLLKSARHVIKAMSGAGDKQPLPVLPIDLRGKRAFIVGAADDNGYESAIAKSLAAAGAEILVGTWVPALNIFETSLQHGKFEESRVLPGGSLMEITKIYPLDAVYDYPEDVPEDVKTSNRSAGSSNWTVKEVAESVKQDFGTIDILVHSLANGPEVTKPLLETSRKGGATISLTYVASDKIVPGYGSGMSSAKAALESDARTIGPIRSRAAKATGFIDMMIDFSLENAPLQKKLTAEEVGNTAAFPASPLASAITGAVVLVDNGVNAMGVGAGSPVFKDLDIPKGDKG